MAIPFSRASITALEKSYVLKALDSGRLSGNGEFTKDCEQLIEKKTGSRALMVHSCTAALELAALLLELGPGDEVILPSFTFVSTANAIVLRGAIPVFVDIRDDTLNMDERLLESAITPKTKAIFVVHYAGIAAEMDAILRIARDKNLPVVEDAAQGIMARYKGKSLGSLGNLGALSFHDTKNLVAGEGGALLVNDESMVLRAEILREKGTNRTSFLRKEIAFYTWMDVGSSYICSELLSAVLKAQIERADEIQTLRHKVWTTYYHSFEDLEKKREVRRPFVPEDRQHNAHIFYLICNSQKEREKVISDLAAKSISATFHYVPLHSSPAGKKFGRVSGNLSITERMSERIVRLPIIPELADTQSLGEIIEIVQRSFR